jgi:tetratricopeptide (TPR) repeat protein
LKLILTLILSVTLCGCGLSTSVDERLARAEQLLAKGSYAEALIELKNAESSAPGEPRLQLLIARASLKLGDLEAVAKALDRASAAQADAREVARVRADFLLARKDFQGLLTLASDPLWAASPPEANVLRARALAGLERCTEAIPLARGALLVEPAPAPARLVLADCYAAHGDVTRALRELEPAGLQDPSVLLARGRLERQAGRPRQAAASWQKAVQLSPGVLDVGQQITLLSSIADLQIERNELDALRETHQRLLAIAPEAKLTVLLAARVQLMEGKTDAAVNELRELATAAPELTVVHSTLASAYIRQRSWEQARREAAWIDAKFNQQKPLQLEKQVGDIAALDAASEQYWLLAAGMHLTLGQMDAVHEAIGKAVAVAPQSAAAQLGQARLELQIDNVERALGISSALIKANPADAAIQQLHADVLQAADRHAEAATLFDDLYRKKPSAALAIAAHRARERGGVAQPSAPLEAWLARNPGDLPVRAAYAEALRKAGEHAQAIREYEAIVGTAPRSVPALNNLAWLYYLAGDKRALDTARLAWQLAPKTPAVLDTYGWLLVENGAAEEGVAILEQADDRIGLTQPEIRVHYVTALLRQGKSAEAQPLVRELLAEKPEFPSQSEAAGLLAALGKVDAT